MRKQNFLFFFSFFVFLCFSVFDVSGVYAQTKSSCGVSFQNVNFTAPEKDMSGTPVPYLVGDDINNTRLSFSVDPKKSRIEGANADIVLVMDRSGSMSGNKILDAKQALLSAVDYVEQYDTSGESRIGLVTFSSSSSVDTSLTKNYQSVERAIRRFSAGGATTIGGGLKTAGYHLRRNGLDTNRQFIILASDGHHNTSPSVSQGIGSVEKDVTVYTIGIGSGADERTLKDIVKKAGTKQGKYFSGSSSALAGIFKDILEDVIIDFEMSDVEVSVKYENQYVDFKGGTPSPSPFGNILAWSTSPLNDTSTQRVFNINFSAKKETPSPGGIALLEEEMTVDYTLFEGTPQENTKCRETVRINRDTTEIIPNDLILTYGKDCSGGSVGDGPVRIGLQSRRLLSSCTPYQGVLDNQEVDNAFWSLNPLGCVDMDNLNGDNWNRMFTGLGTPCERDLSVTHPSYGGASTKIKIIKGGGGDAPIDYDRGIWKETAP